VLVDRLPAIGYRSRNVPQALVNLILNNKSLDASDGSVFT